MVKLKVVIYLRLSKEDGIDYTVSFTKENKIFIKIELKLKGNTIFCGFKINLLKHLINFEE